MVLGAADTFRAAAVEQLTIWADRLGAEIVTGEPGSDPASVAHRAVALAIESRRRRVHRRHGRPAANAAEPDAAADQDPPRDRQADSRGAARGAAGARRHDRPERHQPGPALHRCGAAARASCWPSSTARPKAASWWPSASKSACRSNTSASANGPRTWPLFVPDEFVDALFDDLSGKPALNCACRNVCCASSALRSLRSARSQTGPVGLVFAHSNAGPRGQPRQRADVRHSRQVFPKPVRDPNLRARLARLSREFVSSRTSIAPVRSRIETWRRSFDHALHGLFHRASPEWQHALPVIKGLENGYETFEVGIGRSHSRLVVGRGPPTGRPAFGSPPRSRKLRSSTTITTRRTTMNRRVRRSEGVEGESAAAAGVPQEAPAEDERRQRRRHAVESLLLPRRAVEAFRWPVLEVQ